MIDRRLIKNFDWLTLLFTLLLCLMGILGVFSATRSQGAMHPLFMDHVFRLGLGCVMLLVVLMVDYHLFVRYAYILFFLNILALVAVEYVGHIGMGAQRWLSLGPVRLQPSEFFKISLVLMLARYFGNLKKKPPLTFVDVLPTALALAFPFFLVLKQPDLGTALLIMGIYVIVLFLSGTTLRLYAMMAVLVGAATTLFTALSYFKIFDVLGLFKEYQIRRIKVLFNPDLDPLGAGYHIKQSKIAIGSGGLTGKGFLKGTQSGLHFLPQQHTDFIFPVLAEEGGILFALFILAVMLALLLWGMHVARHAKDRAGALLVLGVVAIFFLHFIINIGMTTGVFPVVGLPLPFLSYGGSSIMASFIGIGLIMNVRMRRFVFS